LSPSCIIDLGYGSSTHLYALYFAQHEIKVQEYDTTKMLLNTIACIKGIALKN